MIKLYLEKLEGYEAKGIAYADDLPPKILQALHIKTSENITVEVEIGFKPFVRDGDCLIIIEAVNLYNAMLGVQLVEKDVDKQAIIDFIIAEGDIDGWEEDLLLATAESQFDYYQEEGTLQ